MTKLYIANCSQQIQQIYYRLVEQNGIKTQIIDIGTQTIVGGELLDIQVDGIITQLSPYGMKRVGELNGVSTQVPLIYQIDRHIPSDTIAKVIAHNRGVLVGEGRRIREEAAVAVNNALGMDGGAEPSTLEMSVTEEKRGTGSEAGSEPLAEGVRVSKTEAPTGKRRK